MEGLRKSFLQGLIEYETPRLVKVHNIWLGLTIRLCQVLVIAYVITYAIIYERGYQVRGEKMRPLWVGVCVKEREWARERQMQ